MAIYGTDYGTPDGTCVRDFIHVSDLVNAHYVALEFLRKGGRKFTANCGYSRGFSVRHVVETVQRLSGNPFPVVEEPRRPGDIPALVADAHRLQSRLGWRPRHDGLDHIVETALAWERELEERRQVA